MIFRKQYIIFVINWKKKLKKKIFKYIHDILSKFLMSKIRKENWLRRICIGSVISCSEKWSSGKIFCENFQWFFLGLQGALAKNGWDINWLKKKQIWYKTIAHFSLILLFSSKQLIFFDNMCSKKKKTAIDRDIS